MDQETLRLEILKLVHRHDLAPQAIVDRAKDIEAYVKGNAQQDGPRPKIGVPVKPGTSKAG